MSEPMKPATPAEAKAEKEALARDLEEASRVGWRKHIEAAAELSDVFAYCPGAPPGVYVLGGVVAGWAHGNFMLVELMRR